MVSMERMGNRWKKAEENVEDSWQDNHMVQKLQIKLFKICDISDSQVQLFWVNNSRILLTEELVFPWPHITQTLKNYYDFGIGTDVFGCLNLFMYALN